MSDAATVSQVSGVLSGATLTSSASASSPSAPSHTAALLASGEKWIWVLDPMTRKLRVPLSYLIPTQATATSGTVPSLCIAYLEGRCRHPWCRQAHVLPSMITQLRHDALNAPTCCHLHHDPHDISMLTARFQTITIADSSLTSPIPTNRIALTVGLQRYLAHNVPNDLVGPNLEMPSKLICRLHLSHRCRYLEDCNNIHVCREFDLKLHPPPYMLAPLLNLTLASRTVTLGDTTYSVTPLAAGEIADEDFLALCELHQNARGGSPLNVDYPPGCEAVPGFNTPPLANSQQAPPPPPMYMSSTPSGLPSFALGNSVGGAMASNENNGAAGGSPVPVPKSPPPYGAAVGGFDSVSPLASTPVFQPSRPGKACVRVYDIRGAVVPPQSALLGSESESK